MEGLLWLLAAIGMFSIVVFFINIWRGVAARGRVATQPNTVERYKHLAHLFGDREGIIQWLGPKSGFAINDIKMAFAGVVTGLERTGIDSREALFATLDERGIIYLHSAKKEIMAMDKNELVQFVMALDRL